MSQQSRAILKNTKRVVIKVGSSLLASLNGGIDTQFLTNLSNAIATQIKTGREIVLVSSGAVAAGCAELKLNARPTLLPQLQATAAVGQCALMQIYRDNFLKHEIHTGQVLLTADDLNTRKRFLHARNALRELLNFGTMPIVNENDTVAVEELKLKMGDNDSLSVAVAQLIDADAVIILSDVPGLYDRPPNEEGAELIRHVHNLEQKHFASAGGSVSGVGTGGMSTKLGAALGAVMGATPMVVADGRRENAIADILEGQDVGTFFAPRQIPADERKHWIAFGRTNAKGALIIDEGACQALKAGINSLLPIGVRKVSGDFSEGDTVSVYSPDKREIARGLINFSAADAVKIIGKKTSELSEILGAECSEAMIHRDNLFVL